MPSTASAIVNPWALPMTIAVGVLGGGVVWLFPSVGSAQAAPLTFGAVAFGLGLAGELLELKGRVLSLPIWLWGLVSSAVGAHALFAAPGLGAALGALALGIAAFVALERADRARLRAEGPLKLAAAEEALPRGEHGPFWRLLAEGYAVPTLGAIEPAHAAHLGKVIVRLAANAERLGLDGTSRQLFEAAYEVLAEVAEGARTPGFFSRERGFVTEVSTLIHQRGAWSAPAHVLDDLREWRARFTATRRSAP